MNTKFLWLPAIALSFMLGQPTQACPTEKANTPCHCSSKMKQLSDNLSLSDAQKIQVKTIRKQAHTRAKANYKELKNIKAQINALIKTNKIDEAKLDALIAQRSTLQAAMLKNHILMQHQIYGLLNDKQKAQFDALKKQQESKHQK
ncbi:MAG: Spy/CpxP family protein refolding chaperone [Legionella sp.]